MSTLTIRDLLDAGVHFGHPTSRWNPKMKPFIHGKRNGIYIFDLTATMRQLDEACKFLHDKVVDGGSVLFVGTKRQAQDLIRDCAERTNMFYVCERWLGGTLTNNQTIRRSIQRMLDIQKKEQNGELDEMPKKEASSLRRELDKLQRNLSGITHMRSMPDVMVVIDTDREDIAVREANRLNIPVVALVDTNCDPDVVEHVIPGNDDALRAVRVVMETLTATIEAAREVYDKKMEEERKAKEAKEKKEAEERAKAQAEAKAKAEAKSKAEEKAKEAARKASKSEPESTPTKAGKADKKPASEVKKSAGSEEEAKEKAEKASPKKEPAKASKAKDEAKADDAKPEKKADAAAAKKQEEKAEDKKEAKEGAE